MGTAEAHRRSAAESAAQLTAVKELELRLKEEQLAHSYAKMRIKDLVHERAGLGAPKH